MNNKPIIDSVRVYQAVSFDKKSETFFSTREINGLPGRKVTIREDIMCVEIQSAMDHILVPFANVSAIYYLSDLKKDQIKNSEEVKAKNTGIKPTEHKRPKKIGND